MLKGNRFEPSKSFEGDGWVIYDRHKDQCIPEQIIEGNQPGNNTKFGYKEVQHICSLLNSNVIPWSPEVHSAYTAERMEHYEVVEFMTQVATTLAAWAAAKADEESYPRNFAHISNLAEVILVLLKSES